MDLASIYQDHGAPALAVALRILGDVGEAEDIVQETFLEVWRHAADFQQGRGSERAWVAAIARNRALDRLRTRERRLRALTCAQHDLAPPETTFREVDERTAIERGLALLTSGQRTVIELFYFGGKTHREIAEETRTPLGTVKTRIRMGLERLSLELNGK